MYAVLPVLRIDVGGGGGGSGDGGGDGVLSYFPIAKPYSGDDSSTKSPRFLAALLMLLIYMCREKGVDGRSHALQVFL